ncbi:leucine-rich repeat-containing protein 17 isoform X2 [Eleutherodactylus coqui]|uniref:leucine-rich repeat-containing protein 17 isoform X2 n=1 Tax=Eleutherodactylus coqui TaxID=57060 RepID=UPI0034629B60
MQVVPLIIILFFCKASEFRKVRRNNRGNNDKSNSSKRSSSTVKRYAPRLPCDIYTYLNEKYLDCQEKRQTTVQNDWPEDLIHILLSRNRIQIIKDNAFSKFQNLKSLDLQQNEITKIEDQAFFGLKRLTTLLLQHNRIKTLSEEVFIQMPRLTYLRLYDNPWDCNCELESLVTFIQIPRHRNFGNYAKCEKPAELKGQKLKEITPQIICQDEDGQPKPLEGPKVTRPSVDSTLCHTYLYPIATLDCRKKAAFSGLMNLHELDLSENKLCNFQYGVLEDLYFLRKLWLRDNPWRCDYNIHYLFYWLKHHYNVNYNGLECKEPQEYKGWFVGKYVRSYYEECPNDRFQVHAGINEDDWEKLEDTKHKTQIESAKTQGVLLTVLTP